MFGTLNAMTNALMLPWVPNIAAARISRASPATRLSPVHVAKMAVERPVGRSTAGSSTAGNSPRTPSSALSVSQPIGTSSTRSRVVTPSASVGGVSPVI